MFLRIICTLCVLIGCAAYTRAQHEDDPFAKQLDYLRRQSVQQIGRDSAVASYEALIKDHASDSRVAEAMLDLAAVFDLEDPQKQVVRDENAAVSWYRKAASSAAPGSDCWFRACFALEGRILHTDRKQAGQILDKIQNQARGRSVILAKVTHERQVLALAEQDWDSAEAHCRSILGWFADPTRIPKSGREKGEVDRLMGSAAGMMVHSLKGAQLPKAERKVRIEKLVSDFKLFQPLTMSGQAALRDLESLPELPAGLGGPERGAESSGITPWLIVLLAGVVPVGGGLLLYYWRLRSGSK